MENKLLLNILSSAIATGLTCIVSPDDTPGQLISGISTVLPGILDHYLGKTKVEEKLVNTFKNSVIEALADTYIEIDIYKREKIADECASGMWELPNLEEVLELCFEKYEVWLDDYTGEAAKIADAIRANMNHRLVNDRQLSEFINFVRLDFVAGKVDELSRKSDLSEQKALSLLKKQRYVKAAEGKVIFFLFPDLKNSETDQIIKGDSLHSPLTLYFKNEYCRYINENKLLLPARILLLGPGGTGKTYAMQDLLCSLLKESMFCVYIPLSIIDASCSFFEYMVETIFYRNSQRTQIFYEKYGKSCRMIYLLDGYNEVSEENQELVNRQIREIFDSDAQIVISSRNRLPYSLERQITSTLKLQPLGREDMILGMAEGGISLPDKNDGIWEILDTPLLLVLYMQLENRYQEFYQLPEWRKNNTKAAIIWNFFQCEYFKVVQENSVPRDGEYLLWFVVYYVIPYISWKMVSLESFYIKSASELNEWVDECFFLRIYQTRRGSLTNEYFGSRDKWSSRAIIKILSELLLPVSFKEQNGYCFRHQNFRDCLAAIHCLNMIVPQGGKTPEAWKNIVLSEEILQYVNELDEDERVESFWKRIGDGLEMKDQGYTVYNMLEFYKVKYHHDLSGICFAGQDLRGVSLNGVKLCSGTCRADFRRARINEATLLPQGHKTYIQCIAATSDGKYVVSGSKDGQIIKWDVKTGNLAGGPWYIDIGVRAIAIAPNDKYMLIGGDRPIIFKWDLDTGKELSEPWSPWNEEQGDDVSQIYITLDGQYALVSGFFTRGILINTDTGKVLGEIPRPYTDNTKKVIFTPDKRFAIGLGRSGDLFKWEILTEELVWIADMACTFDNFELTLDGKHIISLVSDGICSIWDTENGQTTNIIKLSHECTNKRMILTPDGRYAIIFVDEHSLMKIEIQSGKPIGAPWEGIPGSLIEIIITADGRFVIGYTFESEIYKWDAATGELVGKSWKMWNAAVTDIALSIDDESLFSAAEDGLLTKWSMRTGFPLWVSEKRHQGSIRCIRLTKDEKYLLSGSEDGTLIKWNTDTGMPEGNPWEYSDMGGVRTLDISPDGQYVITGSDDKKFRKWDFSTGLKVGGPWEGYVCNESNIQISRDGKNFFCGFATFMSQSPEENNIQAWDMETGKQVCPGWPVYASLNAHIVLSSDGNAIFGGTPNGTMIRGKVSQVQRYMNIDKFGYGVHLSDVTDIALTTHGGYIFSAASNGEIGKWHTFGFLKELFLNIRPYFLMCIDIDADDKRIIGGCNDGTIRIWDLKTKELLRVLRRIPNCNICGCQFQGALFENKELRELVKASGGETEYSH